jgi:hypothetical protein
MQVEINSKLKKKRYWTNLSHLSNKVDSTINLIYIIIITNFYAGLFVNYTFKNAKIFSPPFYFTNFIQLN